ncbi:hypothetical protein SAMN06295912_1502 [Sphingomonas laterariae]|uniref:Uncharacterized protein n=1 Tax=Edaphosphingomonas laterariae TaxID=861865 RepID=A0A239KD36_9SPHN|nr:hypothetical protein [Sphingomonas laterariae]SNT15622.1 hypothetical protein SAMN06295912_1502 [Sphingomonas laterariae]
MVEAEKIALAIEAINSTAKVANVAGDQMGVVGRAPLYVVVNPEEVAQAVIDAIRPWPKLAELD